MTYVVHTLKSNIDRDSLDLHLLCRVALRPKQKIAHCNVVAGSQFYPFDKTNTFKLNA